jgi:hypothetical protein
MVPGGVDHDAAVVEAELVRCTPAIHPTCRRSSGVTINSQSMWLPSSSVWSGDPHDMDRVARAL